MSARESSPAPEFADEGADYELVDTAIHDRIVAADERAASQDRDVVADPAHQGASTARRPIQRRTELAQSQVVARRRTTLLGLGALLLLMLTLSTFAGSWTWLLTVAAALGLIGYLLYLRAEVRRTEERRLTKEVRANRPRHRDVLTASGASQSSQSSLASSAFMGTAATAADPEIVNLDDEDLAFYEIAESSLADHADLSGRRDYRIDDGRPDMYDYDDYSYDSELEHDAHQDAEYRNSAYGIEPRTRGDGDIPHAV